MTPVIVGMLLCVAAAAVILAIVAVPKVRDGAPLLTGEGEDAVREARRRAAAVARQAKRRAQSAAQQAAAQAAAARERTRTTREDDVREPEPQRAAAARGHAARRPSAPPVTGDQVAATTPDAGPAFDPTEAPYEVVAADNDNDDVDVIDVRDDVGPAELRAPDGADEVETADGAEVFDQPEIESAAVAEPSAEADSPDRVAFTPRRRGSHRRLGELGWSDPVPGPRHTR